MGLYKPLEPFLSSFVPCRSYGHRPYWLSKLDVLEGCLLGVGLKVNVSDVGFKSFAPQNL